SRTAMSTTTMYLLRSVPTATCPSGTGRRRLTCRTVPSCARPAVGPASAATPTTTWTLGGRTATRAFPSLLATMASSTRSTSDGEAPQEDAQGEGRRLAEGLGADDEEAVAVGISAPTGSYSGSDWAGRWSRPTDGRGRSSS